MKIKLNCGREIVLVTIYQYRTYAGLLCGVPDEEMNREYIEYNMRYSKEKMSPERCYLVPPKFLELDNIDKRIKRYKDAIRLPYITCFAEFNWHPSQHLYSSNQKHPKNNLRKID